MADAAGGGGQLVVYEAKDTCEGVDEHINPVQYFQKHHPRSRALGGQHTLSDLRLLGGPLRGIAHIEGQLTSSAIIEELRDAMQQLKSVRDVVLPEGGQGCVFDCMGSESEFQVFPVIVKRPDDFNGLPPLQAAVAALGINDALGGGTSPVHAFDDVDDFIKHLEKTLLVEEYPDAPDAATMLKAARQLFVESGLTQGRYMQVVAGDEDDNDNPVLVFFLGCLKQEPYLVGLMSAVIWT